MTPKTQLKTLISNPTFERKKKSNSHSVSQIQQQNPEIWNIQQNFQRFKYVIPSITNSINS